MQVWQTIVLYVGEKKKVKYINECIQILSKKGIWGQMFKRHWENLNNHWKIDDAGIVINIMNKKNASKSYFTGSTEKSFLHKMI